MGDDDSKAAALERLIREGVSGVLHLEVKDLSASLSGERRASGDRFQLIVVSDEAFVGVGLLERQKLVHRAIEPVMKTIHAIEMKTWTLAQYEKSKKV